MTEVPRVELPSLLAQTRPGPAHGRRAAAARDTVERADQDYELELHSRKRSEEVIEAERVASADGRSDQRDRRRTPAGRAASSTSDDDPDDEPHLVDVSA